MGGAASGGARAPTRPPSTLQALAPPGALLPARRLLALLEQALAAQAAAGRSANEAPPSPRSLLADYRPSASAAAAGVPRVTTQVLLDHGDEVWHVAFSPDGATLASGGADGVAILWTVVPRARRVAKRAALLGHTGPVAVLAWAPDSATLASGGPDGSVRLWDAATGAPLATLAHHGALVTALAWAPDGRSLITAGHDRTVHVIGVDVRREGGGGGGGAPPTATTTPLRSWRTQRVNDMAVTPDGDTLLTSSSERRVRAWDVSTGAEVVDGGIAEAEAVVSMSLSRAGDRLLLNLANQQLHAWRLPPGLAGRGAARRGELGTDAASPPPAADAPSPDPAPCAVYRGPPPRAGRFVVRSCFGGVDDGFVASGSEACAVFVWRAATGALLHTLPGHSGTVNAVAWNPADPAMLVSASDDRSVHVWGLPGDARARAEAGDSGADGAGDAGDGVSL